MLVINPNTGKTYEYIQSVPSTVWTIAHNLGKFASVTLKDTDGVTYQARITEVSDNVIQVTHTAPTAGTALIQ